MEDQEEELEIVACEEDGESGKVSRLDWMLSAGLRLGKKVVITGIVASSAPIVLPTLMVISALGFAISVPYGVVFASYVGTEKLMSKLLPPPIQSPDIEDEAVLLGEDEEGKGRITQAMEDDGIDKMTIELVDDDEKVSIEVGNLDDELSAGEVYKEEETERLLEPSEDENRASRDVEEEGIVSGDDATKADDYDVAVVLESWDNEDRALPKFVEGEIVEHLLENEGENNGNESSIVPEPRDNDDMMVLPIVEGQVDKPLMENGRERDHMEEGIVSGVDAATKTDDYNVMVVTESRNNEHRALPSIVEGQVDEPSVESKGDENGIAEGDVSTIDAMQTDDDTMVAFVTELWDNEDRASPIVEGQDNEPLVENEGEKNGMEEGIVHGLGGAKTDDYSAVIVSQSRDNEDRDQAFPIVEVQVDKPLVENEDENKAEIIGKDKILGEENVEETGARGSEKKTLELEATEFLGRNKELEDDKKHEEPLKETKISYEAVVQSTSRDGSSNLSSDKELASQVLMNDDVGSIDGSLEKPQKPVILKEILDEAAQEKGGDERSREHIGRQKGGVPENEILINDDIRNVDGSSREEQKPVEMEELPKGQSAGNGTVSHVSLEMSKEASPSGRSVLPDETAETVPADNKVAESYSRLRMVANDGEYSSEMATIIVMPELKHEEVTPQSKGEEDSPLNGGLHSNEAPVYDEDIWNKINAIRTIVGFKTPRQNSYMEELKALYLFTGIEPPSSSRDSSDLLELNNRLSFLMSVIGVK